jgi:hypothetical protein
VSIFIPGNTAVENTRNLAQSALPDAPVIADEPRRPRRGAEVRARAGALLRTAAQQQLKVADRIDPVRVCDPQPS